MKILVSVLRERGGTLELQAETPGVEPHAPIGLVLPGSQNWLTVDDARALRGILQQAIECAQPPDTR